MLSLYQLPFCTSKLNGSYLSLCPLMVCVNAIHFSFKKTLKRILRNPYLTPNSTLLAPLSISTLYSVLNFLLKDSKSPKSVTNTCIPESIKSHILFSLSTPLYTHLTLICTITLVRIPLPCIYVSLSGRATQ
jgi:hypothetical protein